MRYFIGFLITIGLIIFLIVLLFGGGGGKPKAPTQRSLSSYASTDAVARLTIDGPTNAQSDHDQIQVSVARDQVTFEHLKGYNGNVVAQKTFTNSQNAYTSFLRALSLAGFTRGNPNPALRNEQGYCPLGDRNIFELIADGDDVQRFWSTTCGGNLGTYGGDPSLTIQLFQAQVPNYNDLIQNIEL